MNWAPVSHPGRAAVAEADNGGSIYVVVPTPFHVGSMPTGYVVGRTIISPEGQHDGYIGVVDGEVGVCCGFGMASAIGVPRECVVATVEEAKALAERDFSGLSDGKDLVFVNGLLRGPGCAMGDA